MVGGPYAPWSGIRVRNIGVVIVVL
jgi:hypothetical protein